MGARHIPVNSIDESCPGLHTEGDRELQRTRLRKGEVGIVFIHLSDQNTTARASVWPRRVIAGDGKKRT